MFGSMQRGGANAYATVGVETGVAAATPHKLILMLMDGASIAIVMGKKHMLAGNIAAKGKSITHAIMLIDSGLRGSLNLRVGGDLVNNLDSLYDYMRRTLSSANVTNDVAKLDEVHYLLGQIKEAWEAIAPEANSTANVASLPFTGANDYNASATARLAKA